MEQTASTTQSENMINILPWIVKNETIGAKYASADEMYGMIERNQFIAFHYIDDLFKNAKIQP